MEMKLFLSTKGEIQNESLDPQVKVCHPSPLTLACRVVILLILLGATPLLWNSGSIFVFGLIRRS